MSFATAAGQQNYSGTFIPEIWSPRLLQKFYEGTCLNEICNTDYEGEIKTGGDKVIVRTVPTIAIKDYVKGQKLDFQIPTPEKKEMLIDSGKYWAFVLDKVDAKQMDIPAIDRWTEDAANQMKIAIERAIFAAMYSYANAYNKGATAGKITGDFNLGAAGSPLAITKDNVLDTLVDAGTVLDDQNTPNEDRWMLIPGWVAGMIKKSDLKDASMTGDGKSLLRNGRLGMIDRWTLYSSNLLATGTDTVKVFNAIFGHKSATSFATQLTETGQGDNPFGFGTLVKGLQVYGWKVFQDANLGHLYIKKG